jgi:hypothetical protein
MNHEAITMTASTTPSARCWGKYKRVAVVIVDRDALRAEGRELPASISKHSRGVVRIVQTWENCNVGTSERCAYRRALAEAEQVAARINAELTKEVEK